MILLAFADGAMVRLDVECVEVELRDMGPRVPAEECPGHALTRRRRSDGALERLHGG